MKSLKQIGNIIIIIFVSVLIILVGIINFYIKPIFNLWQDVDINSRKAVDIYYDGEIGMRVIKNILVQFNSPGLIEEDRYEKVLIKYDNSHNKLKEDLAKMYNIAEENISLIEKIEGYIMYEKVFQKEDCKDELQVISSELIKISSEIEDLKIPEYLEQEDIIDLSYEKYIGLKTSIDDFNAKLRENNIRTKDNLMKIFNHTFILIFIILALLMYLMDRIIRKNIKYMMQSLDVLNSNNYNMEKLPDIKIRFKEEKEIKEDIEGIFEERQFINEIKQILSGEYIIDEIIDKLLYLVKDSMNTNRIGVAYIDYKNENIIAEHGAFDYGKVLLGPGFKVPIESTSLKNIIETKKGIITKSIPDEFKKRPHSPSLKLLNKEGVKSNMIIALILNETVFGYLFFSSLKEDNYTKKDLKIGVKIAQEISGILNTTYLTKKMFISTTNAFANLVEKKDNNTGDHILRMTHYSRIIAEGLIHYEKPEYNISQALANDITNYAPIHDIGKVGIPDSILKKPGKLTREERVIVETHAQIGGNILIEVQEDLMIFNRDFFQVAIEIAEGHHEKWDGSGYPKGQAGNEIPLPARIVAIADVFDALSSKRVYKDDFGFENSVQIINDGAGKHFDPELVKVFNSVLPEIRKIYERNKPTEIKDGET